jgi:hypothetical protein
VRRKEIGSYCLMDTVSVLEMDGGDGYVTIMSVLKPTELLPQEWVQW